MAYVYRHIRLDTNEPFYIGIGSDDIGKFTRAYNKKGRSYSWKDIYYKFPNKVEIMLDDLTWEDAIKSEIEFIKLYGRKDLGLGTLVNLTDGGEGQFGRKASAQTREKMRKPKSIEHSLNIKLSHKYRNYDNLKNKSGAKLGVKKSIEHTKKIREIANSRKIKVLCPELNLIFNSLTETGKYFKTSSGHISNVLKSKTNKFKLGLTLSKYE